MAAVENLVREISMDNNPIVFVWRINGEAAAGVEDHR
jgi:hypothetical protein